MASGIADPSFVDMLDRDYTPRVAAPLEPEPPKQAWIDTLAGLLSADLHRPQDRLRRVIESLMGEIDLAVSLQINAILHAPEFQELEATWRGLSMLVRASDTDSGTKVKVLNISKRELNRTLRKFRGDTWDRSPLFMRFYEEEFGQFGGEPFGVILGDYYFDHKPDDVALLSDLAKISAAAHSPFIAGAAPSLLQMDSWAEVANPRDLARIVQTPEYVAWRAMREQEDIRYIGLCMPRFLGRLPYGHETDALDEFAFEEDTASDDNSKLLWCNAGWAFAVNIVRAFVLYGWCVRIRGIDRGGTVEGIPVLHHPTADGDTDRRTVTEICISERREAELSSCGLIPLVHRKNSDVAAFISAQSLQHPRVDTNADATANANLSARLPYIFACSRFAHYLKCIVRDKIGSTMSQSQLSVWLTDWLMGYVDGQPATSTEEFKASHPLAGGRVTLVARDDTPGVYEARFLLRPHYQLEGMSVALRLVSRLPTE
jgi:type VI secretion system protein ImpC